MSGAPDLVLFFGRLHPVLVHLPIGLILLLAGLEVLARHPRLKAANANAGIILALAIPAALGTVVCGWLLSLAGGYEDQLLRWHKWAGIGTAAACLLAGTLYRLELRKSYRWCLFSTVIVLAIASHFGGSLTHGSDYLVRYAPKPWRAIFAALPTRHSTLDTRPSPTAPAFASLIQPVLWQNCVPCHGPEKAKANLRLDSLAGLLAGGESGPVIFPGKAAESLLLKRLRLPPTDDDHMPPAGKPQPSAADLTLLQWWVDAGASGDKSISQLKPSPQVAQILETRYGQSRTGLSPVPRVPPIPLPLAQAFPLAAELAFSLSIPITPLSPTEPWVQGNASIAGTNFGNADLARLAPLGTNVRWLDLAGTAVTDTGLTALAAMPNLTRLHLERTAITDAGLAALAGLPNLQYLNLYHTRVTDAGLEPLAKLPQLKQLYLWQTRVTPAAAAAFTVARTDKDQLQRWADEIEQLKARIKDAQIAVDLGTPIAAVPSTNAPPMNAQCPISGKPVDPAKTVLYEGAVVAFCCDHCKAKFQQDPGPFLSKLGLSATNSGPAATTPR